MKIPDLQLLLREVTFQFARSAGKGGQNVNKVETKAELYFDVMNSKILHEEQKMQLLQKLKSRISSEGVLKVSSQSERTQPGNKEQAVKKFFILIEKALKKEKKRIKSAPTKQSKERRLKEKKIKSEIKGLRQNTYE